MEDRVLNYEKIDFLGEGQVGFCSFQIYVLYYFRLKTAATNAYLVKYIILLFPQEVLNRFKDHSRAYTTISIS